MTRTDSGARGRRLWCLIDLVILVASIHVAALLRFDFDLGPAMGREVLTCAALAAFAHLMVGALRGPYAVGHERGSFEEVVDIGRTALTWALPLGMTSYLLGGGLGPRSLPLTGGAIAVLGMLGARFVIRSARSHVAPAPEASRVIVFGAGPDGRAVVRALLRSADSGMTPVAFLDDDPSKRRLRIDGVKVMGGREAIPTVAEATGASQLVVAIRTADSTLLRELNDRAQAAGLEVLVLPAPHEMLGRPRAKDLRSLDLRDLLGRRPVELDAAAISERITGRVVLVTGAGGSIGAELCRQISLFHPRKLILLDRDESALHATQISITGQGLLDDDTVVLADIRDAERVTEVFFTHRPDIVFHAAALKHLPLLEQYPLEAWKTNVLGTLNVLRAAHAVGVGTFVNISTDKAANPCCVLGYSKRITERLTAGYAQRDSNLYVSVRFGNVLGSRGSVITAFTAQIERGGPVTVTHPDVERYFMLIPEACQLVLQAAAIGNDGEVMVLDMGTPSRIDDVARTLIDLSERRDIEIVYTGLRPGEKMSEELFTPGETIRTSSHPLVSSVDVPVLDEMAVAVRHDHPAAAAEWMRRAAAPAPLVGAVGVD